MKKACLLIGDGICLAGQESVLENKSSVLQNKTDMKKVSVMVKNDGL